jgi:hypothetical protein
LVNWLNTNALKNAIQEFPGDFISVDGRPVFEMVEVASGKKIPMGNNEKFGGIYIVAIRNDNSI